MQFGWALMKQMVQPASRTCHQLWPNRTLPQRGMRAAVPTSDCAVDTATAEAGLWRLSLSTSRTGLTATCSNQRCCGYLCDALFSPVHASVPCTGHMGAPLLSTGCPLAASSARSCSAMLSPVPAPPVDAADVADARGPGQSSLPSPDACRPLPNDACPCDQAWLSAPSCLPVIVIGICCGGNGPLPSSVHALTGGSVRTHTLNPPGKEARPPSPRPQPHPAAPLLVGVGRHIEPLLPRL
jgi:hypothetical protein